MSFPLFHSEMAGRLLCQDGRAPFMVTRQLPLNNGDAVCHVPCPRLDCALNARALIAFLRESACTALSAFWPTNLCGYRRGRERGAALLTNPGRLERECDDLSCGGDLRVTTAAERDQRGDVMRWGNPVRGCMVHVQRAMVLLGRFTAMLADLVSGADGLAYLFPTRAVMRLPAAPCRAMGPAPMLDSMSLVDVVVSCCVALQAVWRQFNGRLASTGTGHGATFGSIVRTYLRTGCLAVVLTSKGAAGAALGTTLAGWCAASGVTAGV